MKYRKDIDGLRAMAVLPVVFFHAGFSFFNTGFLGVDIFFVISGFLITSLILKDISLNKFSAFNFYERRARRILPALILICIISIPVSWIILFPSDLSDFGKSLFTTITFSSNFLFWQDAGYFDIESELKPMLHTWSLSVEEQFYILYPLFLILFWKIGYKKIIIFLTFIFITSFIVSNWASIYKPDANFYLLPTRGWEILAGAIAAFFLKFYYIHIKSIFITNLLGFIGLFLIIITFVLFSPETPSPGFKTLPLVIGTVILLVFNNDSSLIGKLLSFKPIVFIGLISYSWYLWHFPVLAFAKNNSLTGLSNEYLIFLILISLVAAFLSWKYIERPFRDPEIIKRNKFLFILFSSTLTVLICSILFIFNTKSINNIPITFFEPNYGIKSKECNGKNLKKCISTSNNEFILWGDSYAMHLGDAIESSKTKISFSQVTKNTCSPVINVSKTIRYTQFADDCIKFNNDVINSVIANKSIKFVIISSTFDFHNKRPIKHKSLYIDSFQEELIIKNLNLTISKLKEAGKRVLIISATPSTRNNYDPARCTINAIKRNISSDICFFTRNEFSYKTINGYNLLKKIDKEIDILWMDSILCDENICKTSFDENPIYRDNGHLSVYGSKFIGEKFDFNKIILDKLNI